METGFFVKISAELLSVRLELLGGEDRCHLHELLEEFGNLVEVGFQGDFAILKKLEVNQGFLFNSSGHHPCLTIGIAILTRDTA